MTDTITTEVVDQTITALGITLQRATERLATEEAEFIAKRDKMVEVAHRRGTANSIGTSLDDLLEEFDLPRRPERVYLRGLLMISAPVNRSLDHVTTDTGQYLYWTPGMRVQTPVAMDYVMNRPADVDCACDAPLDGVREWLRSYYGEVNAASMSFQIGRTFCGVDDCPNRAGAAYPDPSQAALVDWSTIPSHRVVEQPPVPVPEVPQPGETWYMAGNDLNGSSSIEGEPVTINRVVRPGQFNVTRVSTGRSWIMNTRHLRPTP